MLRLPSTIPSAVLATTLLGMAPPLAAQAPQTTPFSRAALFMKAFGPSPHATELRASGIRDEMQIESAFHGIDRTRAQMAAGELTEEQGISTIETFEGTIREYVRQRSNIALAKASGGRASDMPAIARELGPLLSIARQDALLGHESVAQQAQAQMMKILTTFSQKFAETCEQQNFPIELALGLQRQNLMLGTGIDVWHCGGRKVTVDGSRLGVNYHFETCTLRGDGEWDITLSGRVTGKAKGSLHTSMSKGTGMWEADNLVFRGERAEASGELVLAKQDVLEQDTPAAAPKVPGSSARPNGRPQEPLPPVFHPIPRSVTLRVLRFTTITLRGSRGYHGSPEPDSWVEGEVIRGEEPCRPGDPYAHSARN